MKKIYKYIFVLLFGLLVNTSFVMAAGYSVTTTSNTVTVGNTITLSVKGTDIAGKFSISTSNSSVVSISGSSLWIDNNTQSVTLKANKVGSATITIVPADVSSYSGGVITGNKTVTITVKDKPSTSSGGSTISKPKSSNSYLSSLTVDEYELDSKFDKETLEYSVTIKEGTEKIKINAQLADSSASVTGIGEVVVHDGLNTFNIVVIAENGSKRTYTLKATVLEYEPIVVKVDNKEYTIVRKRKDLPVISDYFLEKDITIDENVIEGYYNETLKYDVVGLKDENGDIKYYIYSNGTYTLYNEQVFNGMVLRVLDKEVSGGYKKTSFSYNNSKIDSYQEVKVDILKNTYALDNSDISGNNFYLFYAINLETGKEELYQYDSIEKTVQRYNTLVLDMYKEQSNRYYLYLLCSILVFGIMVVFFSSIIIVMSKKKKRENITKGKKANNKNDNEIEKDDFE